MKIGITGSLSSGKSTVAKILSKNKKLMFSADKAVINLYSNNKFKKKIKKRFKIKKNNIKSEIKSKLLNKEISLKELGLVVHPFVRNKMREFYKLEKRWKDAEVVDISNVLVGPPSSSSASSSIDDINDENIVEEDENDPFWS